MFSFNFYDKLYKVLNEDTFANRLKNARNRKGLSQSDLSIQVNINRNTIADYEVGLIHPAKDNLIKLGKILDLEYLCNSGYAKLLVSNFDKKLKMWRLSKNISYYEASNFFNVCKDTYYRWEKNTYTINITTYESNKLLVDTILNYY